MPLTLQDFSSVSCNRPKSETNKKPSTISVTKNLKKTLKLNKDIDSFDPKTGKEFTIVAGMQEYAIRRYKDVYIVKPCSTKNTDNMNKEISSSNRETKDTVLPSKKSDSNRAQSAKSINTEPKVKAYIFVFFKHYIFH